jgi:hypothetical protein
VNTRHDPNNSRAARAASCPGCSIPLRFDPAELAWDGPEVSDVMCALCGHITPRNHLLAAAFDAPLT